MLRLIKFLALFTMAVASLTGCGKNTGSIPDPDIARFVAAKRAQAKELAEAQTNDVPATVWTFFDAVERDDWQKATNRFERLREQSGRTYNGIQSPSRFAVALNELRTRLGLSDGTKPALNTELWQPLSETAWAYDQYHHWDKKWLHRFGRDIIDSIPTNSIYFGGTDPGRFVISALSDSHRDGRPFFTITQNQLPDATYLDYLRTMYGPMLYIPTATDQQNAFKEYLEDAQRRLQEKTLKPGEDVRIVSNRVQVSGQIAVMQIDALLAKVIFDNNTNREFYVEESFPLEWMYPHLSPHGLIFKLHREPLSELDETVVNRDRKYWNSYVKELIGDWLTDETSVTEICDFCDKTYRQKNLDGFKGDAGFARNEAAQKTYSKLRSAIGGVYAWRAEHAATTGEKERMLKEAGFAFRQALALCPYSPETVHRYVNLLLTQKRKSDAQMVARTFLRVAPSDAGAKDLVDRLEKFDLDRP